MDYFPQELSSWTGCGLDNRGTVCRFLTTRRHILSPSHPHQLLCPIGHLFNCYPICGTFYRRQGGRCVKLNTQLHLVSRLRTSRSRLIIHVTSRRAHVPLGVQFNCRLQFPSAPELEATQHEGCGLWITFPPNWAHHFLNHLLCIFFILI